MKTIQKISGFTIMELLITLTITSIVIVITFSVFEKINAYFLLINQQNQEGYEILEFYNVLQTDIDKSTHIKKSTFGFEVFTSEKTIYYEFYNNRIARKYAYKTQQFDFDYRDLSIKTLDTGNEFVNYITFDMFIYDSNQIPLTFYKAYSNRFLFNLEHKESLKQ